MAHPCDLLQLMWYLIRMSYGKFIMSHGWHIPPLISHPDEIVDFERDFFTIRGGPSVTLLHTRQSWSVDLVGLLVKALSGLSFNLQAHTAWFRFNPSPCLVINYTEYHEFLWCQLYRHWWHNRLSYRQPPMLTVTSLRHNNYWSLV